MSKFRTRFDKRVRVTSNTHGESRAKQSFRDECDMNNILKKYHKTGVLPIARSAGQYGDFSEVSDYQAALNKVMNAQNAFMDLPSRVRAEFDNDPGRFLQFATDPKNAQRMIDLGLATAVEIVSPPKGESDQKTQTPPDNGASKK